MKLKTLMGIIAAGCVFSSAAFGQTLLLTGTVTALTDSQITMKCGPDIWTIKRDSNTTVTIGNLSIGAAVTVQTISPNAHKQEGQSTNNG